MPTRLRLRSLFLAVPLLAVCLLAILGYQWGEKEKRWDEVITAAIRVESGIRHEPLIALRSKVADLDAAVSRYVEGGHALHGERRVRLVRNAIQHLDVAMESVALASASPARQIPETDWPTYRIGDLAAKDVSRQCSTETGQLFVNASAVPAGSLSRALRLLQESKGLGDRAEEVRFDADKARQACAQETSEALQLRRKEAAEVLGTRERERTAWRTAHPLHVDIEALDLCSLRIDVDGKEGVVKGYFSRGDVKRVDGARSVGVAVYRPECWSVSVNGERRQLSFLPASSEFPYFAKIALREK